MVALHRGNAEEAGQSVGALAVVGTIMDLAHGTALAETIARQACLPPERFLVKGAEFRMTRHPRPHSQHRLVKRMVAAARRGGRARITLPVLNRVQGSLSSSPMLTRTPPDFFSMVQTG